MRRLPPARPTLQVALLFLLVLAGCGRAGTERSKGEALRDLSTAEVMAAMAAASYAPPADGRLTERQVRLYLDVIQRAAEDRVKRPRKETGTTGDLRAALELGINPKELLWVEERVREAWIALQGQELDQKIAASRAAMLQDLEARRAAAADPEEKRELAQQIAEIRAAAPPATEVAAAVAFNAALINRFKTEVRHSFAEDRGPQESENGR